jgi:hypothetical protein
VNTLPAPAFHLLSRRACVLVPTLVVPGDVAIRVGHPGQLRDRIGHRPEATLALLQRVLREFDRRQVDGGRGHACHPAGLVAEGLPADVEKDPAARPIEPHLLAQLDALVEHASLNGRDSRRFFGREDIFVRTPDNLLGPRRPLVVGPDELELAVLRRHRYRRIAQGQAETQLALSQCLFGLLALGDVSDRVDDDLFAAQRAYLGRDQPYPLPATLPKEGELGIANHAVLLELANETVPVLGIPPDVEPRALVSDDLIASPTGDVQVSLVDVNEEAVV